MHELKTFTIVNQIHFLALKRPRQQKIFWGEGGRKKEGGSGGRHEKPLLPALRFPLSSCLTPPAGVFERRGPCRPEPPSACRTTVGVVITLPPSPLGQSQLTYFLSRRYAHGSSLCECVCVCSKGGRESVLCHDEHRQTRSCFFLWCFLRKPPPTSLTSSRSALMLWLRSRSCCLLLSSVVGQKLCLPGRVFKVTSRQFQFSCKPTEA